MQQWTQIQNLSEEGMSSAAIARRLGLDRDTVRKWRAKSPPGAITRTRARSLDDYREYVDKRLAKYPELSARVVHRELRGRGYKGSYDRVKVLCRELRADRPVQATARFETGPGEQAQVDWLESKLKVEHDGMSRRLHGFIYVLGHSRWAYVEPTVSQSQATLFGCLARAFRASGGVPAAILVDNMKAAVVEHERERIEFNQAFLAFAQHWGFEPIAAEPGRGQTKGKVEAGVKYVKRNCLAGQEPTTLAQAQDHVSWWLKSVCNVRLHETTHERPMDRLAKEQVLLRPLIEGDFRYRPQERRRVYLDFTVRWKDNFYEVPFEYAGKLVDCQEVGHDLRVRSDEEEIARHQLLSGLGQVSHLPDHRPGLVRPAYPSHLPFQQESFLQVFPDHQRFVEGCIARLRGNAAYHLHKVRELAAEWGKPTVEAALEQVSQMGAFHVRAVRQACRRCSQLTPIEAPPTAPRALYLPQVEQRPLEVYAQHVR
jgi:transposase